MKPDCQEPEYLRLARQSLAERLNRQLEAMNSDDDREPARRASSYRTRND
jgi:hypothetical protein